MLEEVLAFINENSMIKRGEKVLIALSGGPDSVCLLHVLYSLREILGISIMGAHVNHCLRGKDSDEDEKYALKLCEKLNIPCYVKRIDINKLSKERGLSSEMAGREARYEFFNELKEIHNVDKIALAHNCNDQAETIIMRFMRGAGIEGLTGIKPVRDEVYIRPILQINRQKIEEYCLGNNLKPRIDKTNLENVYSRNKVRLELIPYMQKNFNPDIINTLNRMANIIGKDNEYMDNVAEEKFKKHCFRKNEYIIIYKEAFKEAHSIITRIIRKAINNFFGSLYNLEWIHIYDIITLQAQGTGKIINLPHNIIAENQYGDIIIRDKIFKPHDLEELIIKNFTMDKDSLKDVIELENTFLSYKISFRLLSKDEVVDFNKYTLSKFFDYDKIKNKDIIIRARREGDKFTPYGMSGSKKVKDLLMDLKVPKNERNQIPLFCVENQICWIVGYRISDKYKIEKNTKRILQVKFEREV
ncbi:tRNA lysidine(34) synthetase TilS [Desnuesiella massiliensis]|uniref:tRNA lysidine(34) synthetase TilS n=1 Tax=Desnuesiella massiliensis TaxID=1650662 RepID=UPI0006E3CAC9|nr:tRNA lysidine(34) synthetase TilS [Desnuesiella massiliensis]